MQNRTRATFPHIWGCDWRGRLNILCFAVFTLLSQCQSVEKDTSGLSSGVSASTMEEWERSLEKTYAPTSRISISPLARREGSSQLYSDFSSLLAKLPGLSAFYKINLYLPRRGQTASYNGCNLRLFLPDGSDNSQVSADFKQILEGHKEKAELFRDFAIALDDQLGRDSWLMPCTADESAYTKLGDPQTIAGLKQFFANHNAVMGNLSQRFSGLILDLQGPSAYRSGLYTGLVINVLTPLEELQATFERLGREEKELQRVESEFQQKTKVQSFKIDWAFTKQEDLESRLAKIFSEEFILHLRSAHVTAIEIKPDAADLDTNDDGTYTLRTGLDFDAAYWRSLLEK